MQKEMKIVKEQLDGMSGKRTKECLEANQMKEQLAGLNKKILNEQHATARLRAQVDAMDDKFMAFDEKHNHLQLEIKEKKTEKGSLPSPSSHATPAHYIVPEWVLHEQKSYNIIIFGIQEMEDDGALIASLFHDLDVQLTSDNIRAKYRVGQPSNDR